MTQARYRDRVHSSISTAFTATTSNVLQPHNGMIATEVRSDTYLHQKYGAHYLPTPKLDVSQPTTTLLRSPKPEPSLPTSPLPANDLDPPLYQKDPPVGLGITLTPNDAKQEQPPTESRFFDEAYFRMELKEWSTVFDNDDDSKDL